jgi:hypothetical protein|uniref:Uncharacterized protein n=1 Tax=Bionectria ochroleuca TaxID=29856 RepID=A0A8H7NNU7_BIOOC
MYSQAIFTPFQDESDETVVFVLSLWACYPWINPKLRLHLNDPYINEHKPGNQPSSIPPLGANYNKLTGCC